LGGPIYIPGKFNRNREKLFGFYGYEHWWMGIPGSLQQVTTPTAAERAGDFSNSLTVGGALIPIIDPSTGKPFPGNVVPASQINKNGLALLNLTPLPNITNRAITLGNYNYQFLETLKQFKRNHVFKIDYLPTSSDRISVRGKTWLSSQNGYAVSSGASNWGLVQQCYCFTDTSGAVGYTKTFSPTVVLEALGGVRHSREKWFLEGTPQQQSVVFRQSVGFNEGQWYPQVNSLNIIPRVTWSGITNPVLPGRAGHLQWNLRLLEQRQQPTQFGVRVRQHAARQLRQLPGVHRQVRHQSAANHRRMVRPRHVEIGPRTDD
jgi:hypothetical protein